MNSDTISIIIPIFNAEKTITECVDSILLQSFDKFELLLINDGSSDQSAEICNSFKFKDNRIKFYNLTNGGVSSARNFGIKNSTGKWITFIDSDDTISETFLEELLYKNDFDLAIGGVVNREKDKHQKIINSWSCNLLLTDDKLEQFITHNLDTNLLRTCWGKLYKKDLICNNKILFNEKLRLGEDTVFVLEYLNQCKTIYVTTRCSYIYRVPQYSANKFKLSPEDYFEIFKEQKEKVLKLKESLNINPNQFIKYTCNLLCFDMLKNLYLSKKYNFKQRKIFIESWKKTNNYCKTMGLPDKVKTIVFVLNLISIFLFFDLFLRLYFKLNYIKNRY